MRYKHINDIIFDRNYRDQQKITQYKELLQASRPTLPIRLYSDAAQVKDYAYLCACESLGICYIPVLCAN